VKFSRHLFVAALKNFYPESLVATKLYPITNCFFLCVHRLSTPQRQPSASDPIDGPQAGRKENRQRKRNAHESDEQHAADDAPEKRKPECSDLPAKVRLEVAPSRLASLYVVDDDGNDRRHAKHEGTDNSRGGCHADQQAQRVQGIDTMGNGNKARWRDSDGRCGVVGHERCSFSRTKLRALTRVCTLYHVWNRKIGPRLLV